MKITPLTPQANRVLAALGSGNHPWGLSRQEAMLTYGVQNLTARISELRDHGITLVKVKATQVSSGTKSRKRALTYWRLAQ